MATNKLPEKFINVLSVLMRKSDAVEYNLDSSITLKELNMPLKREGFEAFYGKDDLLCIRHIETQRLSINASPHKPFTEEEKNKKAALSNLYDSYRLFQF